MYEVSGVSARAKLSGRVDAANIFPRHAGTRQSGFTLKRTRTRQTFVERSTRGNRSGTESESLRKIFESANSVERSFADRSAARGSDFRTVWESAYRSDVRGTVSTMRPPQKSVTALGGLLQFGLVVVI